MKIEAIRSKQVEGLIILSFMSKSKLIFMTGVYENEWFNQGGE